MTSQTIKPKLTKEQLVPGAHVQPYYEPNKSYTLTKESNSDAKNMWYLKDRYGWEFMESTKNLLTKWQLA